MKKSIILLFLIGFLWSCSSDDDNQSQYDNSVALELANVAYGTHERQVMDLYLPADRDENTKVIILVHGGAWVSGSKEDFTAAVPVIRAQFPNHAIVNINYRLATPESPAYPKQIDDIESVIQHLESNGYSISDDYAFIGTSAGAHLSMLYSYAFDDEGDVKAVCNIVGPADFTDPAYTSNPLYNYAAINLTGTDNPSQSLIEEVSPITHVNSQSPPTIMFYGGQDPLIPSSQGPLLRDALTDAGVYNEFNFYPDGGHGDWNQTIMAEVYIKMTTFLEEQL